MKLSKNLADLTTETFEAKYSPDNDIAIPGLAITVEKIMQTYGFDAFDRLVQYYGDQDEVGITLGGTDVTQLSPIERARLLNDAYYDTQTLEEQLANKYDPTNPNQVPPVVVEPQDNNDDQ